MTRSLTPVALILWLPALLPAQTPTPAPPDSPTEVRSAEPAAEPLPDWRLRRREFVHQLFGLQAAIETLPGTAFDMARNFPHEWGRTWPGLGKRYWNQYSQFLMSESIEFGVSAAHHEDPRYFRLGPTVGTGARLWHVVKSPWVARDSSDPTKNKIALGRIGGVYGAWFIASRWSPDSVHGLDPFLVWGSFGMATKSGVNALREFWPDLRKHLKH